MRRTVQVVSEGDLDGHEWALVHLPGEVVFIVERSALNAPTLADAWAAARTFESLTDADFPLLRPAS